MTHLVADGLRFPHGEKPELTHRVRGRVDVACCVRQRRQPEEPVFGRNDDLHYRGRDDDIDDRCGRNHHHGGRHDDAADSEVEQHQEVVADEEVDPDDEDSRGGNPDHRSAHLGYCLRSEAWGHGYATEAAGALVTWAYDVLDLNRVQAEVDTRNAASARVLEKLGFVREGTLREDCVVDGEVSDSWVYGLLRRDRPARVSPTAPRD